MKGIIKLYLVLMVFIFLESSVSCIGTTEHRNPPYPKSVVINGINWEFSKILRTAPGSDLWPVTWASDNNLYTSWGDGGGFGGDDTKGRVSLGFARIEGPPTDFKATNVWGGFNPKSSSTFDGKCSGILSVDGVLYAWINMQNGNPPDHRLAWSEDLGKTWDLSNWAFSKQDGFSPKTFLQFGKDYNNARDNYIYSYGAKWVSAYGPENNIFLMRVKKDQIKDIKAYEFFKGIDTNGNVVWTSDIKDRKPVFTDPNGVGNAGQAQVVFHPGIRRYILTVGHRSHAKNALRNQAKRLGIFDAPEPWGPWTTVAYYENWKGAGDGPALGYSFPAKWISRDGKTMWMIYSSVGELDSFNLIKATLNLSKS